ncbi:MAG: hypothetical protein M0021_12760 [Clostridia bacterium]|nr:hypothetical protein [Clostridia bacterium]
MFAYWQALAALVTALEAKDVYTENHSRRVARISKGLGKALGLADAWDAMTSDRVYRKAPTVETAVAEIQKGGVSQFDPGIAQVFLNQVAKGSDFLF